MTAGNLVWARIHGCNGAGRGARLRRRVFALCSFVALLVVVPAEAADRAAAQSLFEEGKRLLKEGKTDEACPKLAESVRLFRSVGGLLNLGRCHELQGKTASAWTEYSEAARMARTAGEADREALARKAAAKLKPGLSKLTIEAPTRPEGLHIVRDGLDVGMGSLGVPIAVDPGEHTVQATAPGHERWSATITVGGDADAQTVTIPTLKPASGPIGTQAPGASTGAPPPSADASEPEEGLGTNHYLAIVAGGLGVAGLGVGTAFGLVASSQWDDAQSLCEAPPNGCSAEGVQMGQDAQTSATISTVGFIVGGVGIAAGVVLWVTAPSGAAATESAGRTRMAARTLQGVHLLPALSADEQGVLLRGSF